MFPVDLAHHYFCEKSTERKAVATWLFWHTEAISHAQAAQPSARSL